MAVLEVIRLLRPSDLPGVRCSIPLSGNYRPPAPANDRVIPPAVLSLAVAAIIRSGLTPAATNDLVEAAAIGG